MSLKDVEDMLKMSSRDEYRLVHLGYICNGNPFEGLSFIQNSTKVLHNKLTRESGLGKYEEFSDCARRLYNELVEHSGSLYHSFYIENYDGSDCYKFLHYEDNRDEFIRAYRDIYNMELTCTKIDTEEDDYSWFKKCTYYIRHFKAGKLDTIDVHEESKMSQETQIATAPESKSIWSKILNIWKEC